ncbi:MAG: GNAT family N-acetyltransferase [Proteobacteria bacterium]|jgi:GNAT superfamily N-acetyltransferase|nr:GNAT family N-acetyltransferase [Pseudomonadota bacterium]
MGAAPHYGLGIRRAKAADAVCISALATQVFLDTYAIDGIRPSLALEVAETLSPTIIEDLLGQPARVFLVAEIGGRMIGFAQLTERAPHGLVPFTSSAELNRLYVQERFCGRGIGTALLFQAETVAGANGAAGMWLTAWSGNARALGFYASRAYTELGSIPFTVQGEEYENRLFAKPLETGKPSQRA